MNKKSIGTHINIFDFQEFQHIIANAQQNNGKEQGASQQGLYHKFKCTIINHQGKQIEGICINEYCKAFNRRTCFDCIIEKLHDKEQQQFEQLYPPQNADQLNQIINSYQQFVSNQIDSLEYQCYFQQLVLINGNNENQVCNNYLVLEKIGSQIQNIKHSKNDLQLCNYLKIQCTQNIGIFNYLQHYYQEIQIIQKNINEYVQKIALNQKCLKMFEMEEKDIEYFEAIKKKKQNIIINIIETKQYQNKEINEEDRILIDNCIKQILYTGNIMYNQGKYENFLQYSELYLKFNNQDPDAHFKIAFTFQDLKRYDEAIQMYDRAIQLNPYYSQAYNNKGISFNNLKRYHEAIQMFDRALQWNPFDSEVYFNKGISLDNLNRYEEAIQMYYRAIQFNPQDLESYINRADLQDLKRLDEALYMYDRAIQLSPQQSQVYYNKGNSLQELKRYDEALQMYNRAIQLNPYYSQAYNNKGFALEYLNRYDEAIQMYDLAIKLNPQNLEAYNNKGNSLKNLKRYEEAIEMYDMAIQLKPQNSEAYIFRGAALQDLKRYDEAIQMNDRALQLNPKNYQAKKNKYICQRQQGYQQQQDMLNKE